MGSCPANARSRLHYAGALSQLLNTFVPVKSVVQVTQYPYYLFRTQSELSFCSVPENFYLFMLAGL